MSAPQPGAHEVALQAHIRSRQPQPHVDLFGARSAGEQHQAHAGWIVRRGIKLFTPLVECGNQGPRIEPRPGACEVTGPIPGPRLPEPTIAGYLKLRVRGVFFLLGLLGGMLTPRLVPRVLHPELSPPVPWSLTGPVWPLSTWFFRVSGSLSSGALILRAFNADTVPVTTNSM